MKLKVDLVLLLFFGIFCIDLNVAKSVESIAAVDLNEKIVSKPKINAADGLIVSLCI